MLPSESVTLNGPALGPGFCQQVSPVSGEVYAWFVAAGLDSACFRPVASGTLPAAMA
jgi:hypothetical protein